MARRGLACVGLGAIAAVSLAVVCAFGALGEPAEVQADNAMVGSFLGHADEAGRSIDVDRLYRRRGPGHERYEAYPVFAGQPSLEDWRSRQSWEVVVVELAGWPRPCLRGRSMSPWSATRWDDRWIWRPRGDVMVPLQPVAAGLAVNALFFAAPLLVALELAGAVRRHARRSVGRCPSCGYDQRGSAGSCPECGHGRS